MVPNVQLYNKIAIRDMIAGRGRF